MRNSALDPLLPRAMQGLLAATCMAADRAWYLSDLAKHLGRTPSTLQEPLGQLVEAGILKRWKDGNRVYFQADPDCPFLAELQGLVAKTVGLVDVLRDALGRHQSRIKVAFVYGSLARGQERSTSDVDLLIIGETSLRQLSAALEKAEEELRRPVNATVYTPAEFLRRLQDKNHFLRAVLDKEKLFVVGTSHELDEITGGRAALDAHQTTKQELDDLRSAVARNLSDAAITALSADNRFAIAYEAALLSAKMAIACAGYRVKGQGAHHTTFQALKLALGAGVTKTAGYLDRCRRKRNDLTYDAAGIVTEQDAEDLLKEAIGLDQQVEAWIAKHHPQFC